MALLDAGQGPAEDRGGWCGPWPREQSWQCRARQLTCLVKDMTPLVQELDGYFPHTPRPDIVKAVAIAAEVMATQDPGYRSPVARKG